MTAMNRVPSTLRRAIVGNPWGTDQLEDPPTRGRKAPLPPGLPTPAQLSVCDSRELSISGRTVDEIEERVRHVAETSGFTVTRMVSFRGLHGRVTSDLEPSSRVLIAERGLKLDKTHADDRTRRATLAAFAALADIALLAILLALAFDGMIRPNLIELIALPAAGGLFVCAAIVLLTFVDFWSEFVVVVYGAPKSSNSKKSEASIPPRSVVVRVWAGVARTQNWQSEGLGGRMFKEVFAEASVNSVLVRLVEEVSPATPPPLLR